jgi:hypothetical protein
VEDSGPEGSEVIFLGTAVEERRGYTKFTVSEVLAGPDLAPGVWVRSGQDQGPWPLYFFQGVGSSVDAEFEIGRTYIVGASDGFSTSACSIDYEPTPQKVAALRQSDAGRVADDGSSGADPPMSAWLATTLALGALAAAVGVPVGLLVRRLKRRRAAG